MIPNLKRVKMGNTILEVVQYNQKEIESYKRTMGEFVSGFLLQESY
jgi:hypothetical protein